MNSSVNSRRGVVRSCRAAAVALAVSGAIGSVVVSCGGSSEPSGDQVAAAEKYIANFSPENPDCVMKEHKKLDNASATLYLQAYTAYAEYDYEAEDAALAQIDDDEEMKFTAALNKCALG